MVENARSKRPSGRPRKFVPEDALDRAVEMFWVDGFEGVDVDRIARAVGVTKPSLYRLFGDKSSLFLHALRRYGETVGAAPLAAFSAQPDIAKAVTALLEETVRAATTNGRASGCLIACVAIAQAGRSEQVRLTVAQGLATLTEIVSRRFDEETQGGRLSASPLVQTRSRMLVDLMQGLILRARGRIAVGPVAKCPKLRLSRCKLSSTLRISGWVAEGIREALQQGGGDFDGPRVRVGHG